MMRNMVIAAGGMKGGSGKSTLCRALAVVLASMKFNVMLADCDYEQSTTAEWAKRREAKFRIPFVHCKKFASIKAAYKEKEKNDYLIIDTKPRSKALASDLGDIADLMLLPCRPCLDDCGPTADLADSIRKNFPQMPLYGVLFCTATDRETFDAREELEARKLRVLMNHIPDKPGYRLYMDRGLSLTECKLGHLATKASAVTGEILGIIEGRNAASNVTNILSAKSGS